MNEKRFLRWSKIRSRGQLHYVLFMSLIISISVTAGRLISQLLNDKYDSLALMIDGEITSIIFSFIITPLIVIIFWYYEETQYKKELFARTNHKDN
ncbi:hypothetical protein RMN64_15450 [Plesiomonas shigelloides]|uniref:hypothetical protein n=1 Tax=Plesiomonas shigelloides TaxID=703 RepID=UPI00288524A8|nr:hypothetical protein [Plesiomonas shigelloides]MDT1012810.1 hypothetical protein [Plesiomonas shigelloides]